MLEGSHELDSRIPLSALSSWPRRWLGVTHEDGLGVVPRTGGSAVGTLSASVISIFLFITCSPKHSIPGFGKALLAATTPS